MKSILTTIALLVCVSSTCKASTSSNYQEWTLATTSFDFSTCQEIYSQYAKTYSSAYSNQEIINAADGCRLQSAMAFMQRFIQFGDQSKISSKGLINNISILNQEGLQRIYDELLKNPYFPYEVLETQSCFYRAKYIAFYLQNRGIQVGEVTVNGDFLVSSRLYPNNKIHWDTHTAVFLYNSENEKIVIDPSLTSTPIAVKDWTYLLTQQSTNKKFKQKFSQSYFIKTLYSKKQNVDSGSLKQLAGIMTLDTYHLLNHSRPVPERITPELLSSLIEFTEFYYRKKPALTGDPN
ncbi:MAG: hypothetical protein IPM57_12505 [Oligoflexia bacterium]|nr:hypothetical protein [Oligoflexia bacterium]